METTTPKAAPAAPVGPLHLEEGAMPEREKRFKEVKGYKSKIKRHKDAVLKLHSI